MKYYIQGNKEKADQIKAAFERLGYDVKNWLFTTGVYYTLNGRIVNTKIGSNEYELILNSSDYKELELPKPHYDITNFHAGMPVLVRWYNTGRWRYSLYSFYEEDSINPFDTVKGSFTQCIPFNEDTKHLLGTTDMPSEEYINW